MGGPSGGNSGGSGNDNKTKFGYSKPKSKVSKIGDFIKGGGITGAIVKGIGNQIKKSKEKKAERKANDSLMGTPDYQGSVSTKRSKVTAPIGGNDRDDNPKSDQQPKVKSQMDNTEIKSDEINADATAPTSAEMPNEAELTEDEKLIKRKRGRKTKTILSSVTGDNTKATLSKKTLLG